MGLLHEHALARQRTDGLQSYLQHQSHDRCDPLELRIADGRFADGLEYEGGTRGQTTPTNTPTSTPTNTPVQTTATPTRTPTSGAAVVVPTLSYPMLGLLGLMLAAAAFLLMRRS